MLVLVDTVCVTWYRGVEGAVMRVVQKIEFDDNERILIFSCLTIADSSPILLSADSLSAIGVSAYSRTRTTGISFSVGGGPYSSSNLKGALDVLGSIRSFLREQLELPHRHVIEVSASSLKSVRARSLEELDRVEEAIRLVQEALSRID